LPPGEPGGFLKISPMQTRITHTINDFTASDFSGRLRVVTNTKTGRSEVVLSVTLSERLPLNEANLADLRRVFDEFNSDDYDGPTIQELADHHRPGLTTAGR
jgi:hypothetical protein